MLIRQSSFAKGIEQKIWPTNLKEKEMKISFPKIEDPNLFLQEQKERYFCPGFREGWDEIIFALPNLNPEIDPENFGLITTTSYHIQAMKKNLVDREITPITSVGLILTSDNKFVYGIRSGVEGIINIVPGGYVSLNKEEKNPIFAAFYLELVEETGIENSVQKPRLIGYQTDPQHNTFCFVFGAKTNRNSQWIYDLHQGALDVYKTAKSRGSSELEARAAIKEANYKNVDAWENYELVFIENDLKVYNPIIESGRLNHKNTGYKLFDNSVGALMLYGN